MTEERAKRKLSAVLSADVKGYSRLMGQDEAGTVDRLKEYRSLMTDIIQKYRGRVVDSPGDNLLAEFASVVDATECSVQIQKELHNRNAELPNDSRMEFRIGINLGDEIRNLIFGRSIIANALGYEWQISFIEDGKASWQASWGSSRGTYWIEGDQLWIQWKYMYEGLKWSSDIYRNPGGTAERENEYSYITDWSINSFSVAEKKD